MIGRFTIEVWKVWGRNRPYYHALITPSDPKAAAFIGHGETPIGAAHDLLGHLVKDPDHIDAQPVPPSPQAPRNPKPPRSPDDDDGDGRQEGEE